MSAQGKRLWHKPALRLLKGKLSRGKTIDARTEVTVTPDGTTENVYTPDGATQSIYSDSAAGPS